LNEIEFLKFKELLRKCYLDFQKRFTSHRKAYDYYCGKSDAMENYKFVTDRSNNKTNVNFVKKFVKEETSYSFGNQINYISKKGDKDIINDIDFYFSSWDENHNIKLANKMILHGIAYELYYLDDGGDSFKSRIVTPMDGYIYEDINGNVVFFMHIYKLKFDESNKTYVDVYTNDKIYFFDDSFSIELKESIENLFGRVPVGIARLSDEEICDTIFNDIKGLLDAYETNLSDISNEISDFRNAYMVLTGVDMDEKQATELKSKGILKITASDGSASWLIKSINDSFIQNTLSTLEDKIYQLTSHINHNESLASNISGVALRSRLIALENKCTLNQKAFTNLIKTRLEMLFIFLAKRYSKSYDYRDIKVKYTANVPQDDIQIAQIISQLGDKLSLETSLSLLSFIENPQVEIQKIKNDNKNLLEGSALLGDLDE
jgi:SPP1 family phage portal protein